MLGSQKTLRGWKNGDPCYKFEEKFGKGIASDNLKAEDGPIESVVSILNQGWFCIALDIWQCLETFSFVTTVEEGGATGL